MEKLEPLCIADGSIKWCSHCGKECAGFLKKLKIELPYDPQFHPKELKWGTPEDICTAVFIAVLFTIA